MLAWEFSNENVATIHAETNGTLVCLSADVSGLSIEDYPFYIYPPTGFEPIYISITQFTSDYYPDQVIGNVTAFPSLGVMMLVTNTDYFDAEKINSFTLIYPIAS